MGKASRKPLWLQARAERYRRALRGSTQREFEKQQKAWAAYVGPAAILEWQLGRPAVRISPIAYAGPENGIKIIQEQARRQRAALAARPAARPPRRRWAKGVLRPLAVAALPAQALAKRPAAGPGLGVAGRGFVREIGSEWEVPRMHSPAPLPYHAPAPFGGALATPAFRPPELHGIPGLASPPVRPSLPRRASGVLATPAPRPPELPGLSGFVDIFLLFGAEAVERLSAQAGSKERLLARLEPAARDAFCERRRCTFSWMTDTTSLALVRGGIAPNIQNGPNLLYSVVVGVVALNSRERFEAFAPLDVAAPLSAAAFAAKFEPLFGRAAPPQAILQAVRCTLQRYRRGNHFENTALFVEDMGRRVPAAWAEIEAAGFGPDAPAAVLRVLRGLGLGPFCAIVAARLLSVADPRLFDLGHQGLGQYARMGLGLMTGLPREEAKAFSTDRKKAAEADCLFATLLAALPAALRQRDTDGVIAQLERLHLQPLAAQTVEHMLCEYRKILAPGGRTRGGSRTTAADYAALWAAAAPLYARRAA